MPNLYPKTLGLMFVILSICDKNMLGKLSNINPVTTEIFKSQFLYNEPKKNETEKAKNTKQLRKK